jgi:molybdate transport system substrate-binding protein
MMYSRDKKKTRRMQPAVFVRRMVVVISAFLSILGCDPCDHPLKTYNSKPEILLYVGETMADVITDLAGIFEKREPVVVKMITGGSGFLKDAIELNRVGDIFFPGNKKYFNDFSDPEIIGRVITVGYNEAALFVSRGNPKQIVNIPEDLLREDISIAIGSPLSGSIGRETARILHRLGIYQPIIRKAVFLAVDSKLLTNRLLSRDVDVIINWKATGYTRKTRGWISLVPLPDPVVQKQPLAMARLGFSRHPDLADKFMALAVSDQGQELFKQYGFKD